MRLLKIVLGVVGLFVVLVIGAAIAIPLLFEPNDFKPEIAELVEEETGRQITIDGDIGLSVFPWVAVELGKTRFANAEGFGDEPMAEFSSAKVRVKLLPLLKKQIQIGKVTLDGATVRLARDQNGRSNWDDITERQASNQTEKQPAEEKQGEFDMTSLSVAGLALTNSRVYWSDKQADADYQLENVNLETGAIAIGDPIDLELAFSAAASQPQVASDVELEGQLQYDLEKQQYAASGLQLQLKASGSGIPVELQALTLSGDVSADAAAQRYEITNMQLNAKGEGGAELPLKAFELEASGKLNADMAAQLINIAGLTLNINGKGKEAFPLARFNASLSGDVTANPETQQLSSESLTVKIDGRGQGELPLRDFTAALTGLLDVDMQTQTVQLAEAKITAKGEGTKDGPARQFNGSVSGDLSANLLDQLFSISGLKVLVDAQGKSLPGEAIDASLTGQLTADMQQQTVTLEGFLLETLGLKASGLLSALQINTEPQFGGAVTVETFNPTELVKKLKIDLPPMAGPNVMQKAAFRTQLSGNANSLSLNNLQLMLDETQAAGVLTVADFSDPKVGFNVVVDKLNADAYLPPKTESKPGASEQQKEKDLNKTPVDLSALEALNIEGNAQIGKLTINELDLSDVKVGIKAQGGDVLLSPLALNLYGGSLDGNLAVNVKSGQQTIRAKQTLRSLQFEPFTRALMGDAKIAGSGDLQLDITTNGATVGALRKNLNGTVDVGVDNGAVLGINIAQFLRTAKAKLTGDSALSASAAEARNTDFAKITASAQIVNGVLSNPDLLGKSPALRLQGEGSANLFTEALNYKTSVTIVETSKGQGGDDLGDLRGLSIPISIGGTFTEPKIKLDMKAVLKAALASKLDLEAKEAELRAKVEAEKQRFEARKDEEKAKLEAKLADEKRRLQDKLNAKLGDSLKLDGEESEGDSLEDKASKELERGFKKLFGN